MTKLYILSGLPFSGKTYLSKKIVEAIDCELVSYDDIWEEKRVELDKWLDYPQVTKIAHERIKNFLEQGRSVVYDELADCRKVRDELVTLAEKTGAESMIIYVNTPDKVRTERHRQNKVTNERHDIRNQRFNNLPKYYDPPCKDENYVEYKFGADIDEWISQYLK